MSSSQSSDSRRYFSPDRAASPPPGGIDPLARQRQLRTCQELPPLAIRARVNHSSRHAYVRFPLPLVDAGPLPLAGGAGSKSQLEPEAPCSWSTTPSSCTAAVRLAESAATRFL
jgi:hypothetical protein